MTILTGSLPAAAQVRESTATSAAASQTDMPATAPVVIDGRTLFEVRGVSSLPASERAAQIAERIIAVARDENQSVDNLRIEEGEKHHAIFIGDHKLMEVHDADARVDDLERPVLARVHGGAIAEAVTSYRRDRSRAVLLKNLVTAVLATLLFIALLAALSWIRRKLQHLFESRYKARLETVEEKSFKLLQAEQLWGLLLAVQRIVAGLLVLLAIYIYLNSVLSLFPWTRPIGTKLLQYLLTPVKAMGTGLLAFLPNFFFLLILFLVVRFFLRALHGLFSAVARGRVTFRNFETDWAWPTYRIVRVAVIAFAAVVAYPYIPGSDSAAFKGLTLFFGLLFSLGSSSFISNIIAGYMLTYRRAFKPGDIIRVGDIMGEVIEARVLETHLRTPKNEEVVLPNSGILNGQVINYSSLASREGLVLYTTVGIGYEVPWRQVEAMLLSAAKRTRGILTNREPFVLQKALGDFGITYELNVFCNTPEDMPAIYSNLHRNIQDAFNEYGVSIMTPAYESDPAEPKFVPKEKWYAAPATAPEK